MFQYLLISPFSFLLLSDAKHKRELAYYLSMYLSSFTGTAAPIIGEGG